MLHLVEETIKSATPHILGIDAVEEFPEADPEAPLRQLETKEEAGLLVFPLLITLIFLLFNLISLITKGHTFPRLDYDAQSDFIERVCQTTNPLLAALWRVMFMPFAESYYTRTDVNKILGFDTIALKEESELRRVTRDGGPLPPKTEPQAQAADDRKAGGTSIEPAEVQLSPGGKAEPEGV